MKFQPHKFALAERNLKRQRYVVFCPMISKHVRHARKSELKRVPLFPGYFFTSFDPDIARWKPIDSTPGVVSLVKIGSRPIPLPRGLVENLQASVSQSGVVRRIGPNAEVGDDVRVVGSSFDNWLGRVVALPAQDRITVLLEAASRKIEVTLDAGKVMKVATSKPLGAHCTQMGV